MLTTHFRIALRRMSRQKGYTLLNVGGLAVGIACCLLIALYVRDELSYDRFHEHAERIYRVTAERGEGDDVYRTANTSYPVVPHLRADFPEVRAATRLRRMFRPIIQVGEQRFREEQFFAADSTFFDVFSFPLVRGGAETVLDAPDAVVLTEETARRYFGDADPVGQTLTYQTGAEPVTFTVTGVLADLPATSHVQFDFLGRLDRLGGPEGRWQVFVPNYSYVLLPEGFDPARLAAKLPAFVDRYVGAELEPGEVFALALQPLTDIHLHSDYQSEIEPNGDATYVALFAAVAVFILLIACANFINLTTAQATQRAREVGVRKAVGAQRRQLIAQFLGESTLLGVLALALGVGLARMALPAFNALSGRALDLGVGVGDLALGLLGLAAVVSLAAGAYPAFYLAAFRPATVLKGSTSPGPRGALVRRGLVVFQFTVSIALLVCTGIVLDQMRYVQERDLGFVKEQVVVIPIDGRAGREAVALTQAFEESAGVVSASASLLVPSADMWTYSLRRADRAEGITTGFYKVDHGFVETYGLALVAGRAFDPARASDSTAAFLVNEEAVRRLGYSSPEAALGEPLLFGDGSRTGTVVGVVADFNAESLHRPIEPLVFFVDDEFYYVSARVQAVDLDRTLAFLEGRLATFAPHLPFEYFFVDERFDALHRADRRLAQVLGAFAVVAGFVACLGLFGLAAFAAQRRTKEIGVRKVLGAGIPHLVALVARDFVMLVLVAFALATPLAYAAMSRWLESFAYRIDLGPLVFVVAGVVALAVALVTVSYHALRTATADPVRALRYE